MISVRRISHSGVAFGSKTEGGNGIAVKAPVPIKKITVVKEAGQLSSVLGQIQTDWAAYFRTHREIYRALQKCGDFNIPGSQNKFRQIMNEVFKGEEREIRIPLPPTSSLWKRHQEQYKHADDVRHSVKMDWKTLAEVMLLRTPQRQLPFPQHYKFSSSFEEPVDLPKLSRMICEAVQKPWEAPPHDHTKPFQFISESRVPEPGAAIWFLHPVRGPQPFSSLSLYFDTNNPKHELVLTDITSKQLRFA